MSSQYAPYDNGMTMTSNTNSLQWNNNNLSKITKQSPAEMSFVSKSKED